MDRRSAIAVIAALVVSFSTPAHAAAPHQRYIVVYRPGTDAATKTAQLERSQRFASEYRYTHAIRGFAAKLSDAQVASLRADPSVAFVGENKVVKAIGQVPLQQGDSAPPGVRRIGAATATTASQASDVAVAVIDTGIDLSHPDLNAVNGINCVSGGPANDDNGHGTHVAGSIGAKNNGAGVVGVAPGTRVYAVKVLNAEGSGDYAEVICGIDWITANAAALNIKVANMSLGGPGPDDGSCGAVSHDALHAAVCRSVAAGVTYVVAAGNSAEDFAGSVPATFGEVLTVTAIADFDGRGGGLGSPFEGAFCLDGLFSADDSPAWFSNFTDGSEASHTIAAPGTCIESTWLAGGYETISGTSMAAPHVAGAVALCYGSGGAPGQCDGLAPAQVIGRMRDDAMARARSAPDAGYDGDPDHPGDAYYGYLVWAGGIDTTAPVISDVHLASATHISATIAWTTNEPADGQVEWGATTAYGQSTAVATEPVLSHAITITGLTPVTTYHYRVKSRDGWGNVTVSDDATFTTTPPRADLVLTGNATPEPVTVGDPLTYSFGLANAGPAAASDAVVTVTLPSQATLVSSTVSQGSCSGTSTLSCALGTLETGTLGQLLADDPAALWRLSESTGNSAADASGTGLSGTYGPGVSLGQPGAVAGDSAAAFANGTLTVPASALLDLRNAFSVEAWVRPNAAGQNGGILEKTVGGTLNTQYLLFLEGGLAKFRLRGAADGTLVTVSGPAPALDTWTHLVGTFDGSALRLYVNGSLVGSAPASAAAGGGGVTLIGRLGSNIYPFAGALDEVAVYPTALGPARVRAHYLGSAALQVVVRPNTTGTIAVSAAASAAQEDPVPGNNTLALNGTVTAPRADLVLTGTASPDPVNVGDLLSYSLTLSNSGPGPAGHATITLALPPQATLVSSAVSQGTCSGTATLTCALGTLDQGTSSQLLSDGPAAYWRLGESSGPTAADASGNAVSGTYEAGVALGQPGAVSGDSAAAFSGGALVVPANAALDLRGAFSVEAWVRPSFGGQNGGILEKTVGGAVNTQYLLFLEGGVAKFRTSSAAALVTVSGPAPAPSGWTHLAGTFDGTTLRLYVNGALASASPATAPTGGSGVTLVGRLGSNIYQLSGSIDEVAVYPIALSASRVRAHYQGGAALHVAVRPTAAGALSVDATASADQSDPVPANNTLSLSTTVSAPRADLVLSGSAAPEPVVVGDALTYTLALTNAGPVTATDTTLSFTVPAGTTLVSSAVSQGSCTGTSTLNCALGALSVGTAGQLLADGPAGFWRLGESGGSVANDASPNGLAGSYGAGITLGQSGAVAGDSAAAFNGGATLTVPAASALDLRGAFSVEAWVRPSAAGQNGGILEKTVGGTLNTQYLLFLEGGLAKIRLRSAADGTLVTVNGPAVAPGTWTHLVGTFDGSVLRLYVNGGLVGSAPATAASGGSGITLIGRLGNNIYHFAGSLDEIAVYPSALSAARVRAHYLGSAALQVVVRPSTAGTLSASATADAAQDDPVPGNNTVTIASTASAPRADLALSGSAAPQPVNVGELLTYDLVLSNRGPAAASGATLELGVPAQATLVSSAPSQGSCSGTSTVVCALGALEVGSAAQLQRDAPAAYWRMGESAGPTAADASGNGLSGNYDPGVVLGQPGAVAGDTAAAFSGGTALVVPASSALDLRGAFSVEAWVRPTAGGQNGGILEKTVGGAVNTQYLLFLEAGVAKMRVSTPGGLVTVNGPSPALNTWTHLVGTFDGATLRLYVNGAPVGAAAATTTNGGSGSTLIGRLGSNIYYFSGAIDEVAVYAGALSAERVRAHHQGGATVRVVVRPTAAGTLTATATASAAQDDPVPANNALSFSTTVNQ